MNLDLLIKLAKLANNNPNEHEANSAARRACKLIAEGDYKFTEVKITSDKFTGGNRGGGKTTNSGSSGPWKNPFSEGMWTGFHTVEDYYNKKYGESPVKEKGTYKSPYTQELPERECSECGSKFKTSNQDRYYICAGCYDGRNPFYKKF